MEINTKEKKTYGLLRKLFSALAILLFVVVENYAIVNILRSDEVAVQDLPLICEQGTDGKYYFTEEFDFANVYNGTGRTVKDVEVTANYIGANGKTVKSETLSVGDFEPYMQDGKFNAYALSFRVSLDTQTGSDTDCLWIEFEVSDYAVAWTFADYLMIGAFVIGCASTFMAWCAKKSYVQALAKITEDGEKEREEEAIAGAVSVAAIGEETPSSVEKIEEFDDDDDEFEDEEE